MSDGGGAAATGCGAQAQQHVFGTCDLCSEETDQSTASLVLVVCNQRACPDRRASGLARSRSRAVLARPGFRCTQATPPWLTRRARRVYHQDCLLDYIESASTSRRRASRARRAAVLTP